MKVTEGVEAVPMEISANVRGKFEFLTAPSPRPGHMLVGVKDLDKPDQPVVGMEVSIGPRDATDEEKLKRVMEMQRVVGQLVLNCAAVKDGIAPLWVGGGS